MQYPWIDIEEVVTAATLFCGSAIVSCVLVFGIHGVREVRAESAISVELGPSLVLDTAEMPAAVSGWYRQAGEALEFRVSAATDNRPHKIFVSTVEGPLFAQVTSRDGVLLEMTGGTDDLLARDAPDAPFQRCHTAPCRVDVLRLFEYVRTAAPKVYTALQMHLIGAGLGTLSPSI